MDGDIGDRIAIAEAAAAYSAAAADWRPATWSGFSPRMLRWVGWRSSLGATMSISAALVQSAIFRSSVCRA